MRFMEEFARYDLHKPRTICLLTKCPSYVVVDADFENI